MAALSAHRSPTWRDWLVVVACLVCQIGMGVGGYIWPVFLKPVVSELQWSRAAYAWANPVMSTVVALAGPAVGWASDRWGPRPVLLLGGAIMGGALWAASAIMVPLQLYAVAAAIGIAVACLGDLPTGTAIGGRFRTRPGLALGLVYIGSNIGGALIPLVSTALATADSWRTAFSDVGIGVWLVVLPFAVVVTRPRAAARTPGDPSANDGALAMRAVVRQRDFWLLAWVLFAFYVYRLGVTVHLVAYLTDVGLSQAEAAGGLSASLALGIAGKLLAGAIADRVGAKPAVVGNFVLVALASALLLLPPRTGVIPLFLLVHGVSTAAEDVVIPLIIGRRFGIDNLGRIYGWLLVALIPGGTLGPVLAAYVFDWSGSYALVFAVFFALNLSAVPALALVRPRGPISGATGLA